MSAPAASESTAGSTVMLRHNRVDLALHTIRAGEGRPLLLLHPLGDRSPSEVPPWATDWPGPVAALDFTGHGASTVPQGGGYTAEILLADADAALAHLGGELTVAGSGLGAYVALMLAGARAADVVGAVLLDGPGLAGGAASPTAQPVVRRSEHDPALPDPYAVSELSRDLRPGDYAATFVRLALQGSRLDEPISVAARFRPAWLADVVREHGVVEEPADAALRRFATA